MIVLRVMIVRLARIVTVMTVRLVMTAQLAMIVLRVVIVMSVQLSRLPRARIVTAMTGPSRPKLLARIAAPTSRVTPPGQRQPLVARIRRALPASVVALLQPSARLAEPRLL